MVVDHLNRHALIAIPSVGVALLFFVFYHALSGAKTQGKLIAVILTFIYGLMMLVVPILAALPFSL